MNFEEFVKMTEEVRGGMTPNEIMDNSFSKEHPYTFPIVDLSISARPSEDSIESVKKELSKFCEKMGV